MGQQVYRSLVSKAVMLGTPVWTPLGGGLSMCDTCLWSVVKLPRRTF